MSIKADPKQIATNPFTARIAEDSILIALKEHIELQAIASERAPPRRRMTYRIFVWGFGGAASTYETIFSNNENRSTGLIGFCTKPANLLIRARVHPSLSVQRPLIMMTGV
jgi:hypothetical protein